MLSESQERMLFVAHKGREQELIDIFQRWGLQAVVAGTVIEESIVRILFQGRSRLRFLPQPWPTTRRSITTSCWQSRRNTLNWPGNGQRISSLPALPKESAIADTTLHLDSDSAATAGHADDRL